VNCFCINVVVTCAARKTGPARGKPRVKNLTRKTLNGRFREWSTRISRNDQKLVKAIDLYRGNSWSIIRKLQEHPKHGRKVRLWIVSAGHGLISAETPIAPYAATFTNGHADFVKPMRPQDCTTSDWWNQLVRWRRRNGNDVASISDIAERFPNQPLLIAISNEYLAATFDDIAKARTLLSSSDKLVIICAGAKKNDDAGDNFLPCDARFENHFHCCRADLNAQLLASIVKTHSASDISASKLRETYTRKLNRLPKANHPKRARLNDEALESFVTIHLLKRSSSSHTNLLRLLRSENCGCEQKRFRKLFKRTKHSLIKQGALL
jgi:hypothetical protein